MMGVFRSDVSTLVLLGSSAYLITPVCASGTL
jgi:hypothetical protein